MLRDWLSDLAMLAGCFCRNRMTVWHRRGEWCADVSEWLTTSRTWSEIRAQHFGEGIEHL